MCVGPTRPRIEPGSSGGSVFPHLGQGLFLSPSSSPGLQLANTANFSTSLRCLATTRESTLPSERTIVCTSYSPCSPIWARTWAHTMINSNQAYSKVLSRTCFSHLTQTCALRRGTSQARLPRVASIIECYSADPNPLPDGDFKADKPCTSQLA